MGAMPRDVEQNHHSTTTASAVRIKYHRRHLVKHHELCCRHGSNDMCPKLSKRSRFLGWRCSGESEFITSPMVVNKDSVVMTGNRSLNGIGLSSGNRFTLGRRGLFVIRPGAEEVSLSVRNHDNLQFENVNASQSFMFQVESLPEPARSHDTSPMDDDQSHHPMVPPKPTTLSCFSALKPNPNPSPSW